MKRLFLIVGVVLLAGCGGETMMSCDEGPYQAAIRAPRVEAPEGLDNLDPLKEAPLPEASPRDANGYEGPCLESPPQILKLE